jgi:hypothetical protein
LNFKYEEIRELSLKRIEEFFKTYEDLQLRKENEMDLDDEKEKFIRHPLNKIFQKILMENNSIHQSKKVVIDQSVEKNPNNTGRSRVIIFSDMSNDANFDYDQKLLYLMKKQNISVDCVSIGTTDVVNKLQSIAYYADGNYENLPNIDGMGQTLLQQFLPMPENRKNTQSLYTFQNNLPSKLLACQECKLPQEFYFLVTDTREIFCNKCMRDKFKK